jgi:hypothetical protein
MRWMITCLAVWAAIRPKSEGVSTISTVSPSFAVFLIFLASARLISINGSSMVGATVYSNLGLAGLFIKLHRDFLVSVSIIFLVGGRQGCLYGLYNHLARDILLVTDLVDSRYELGLHDSPYVFSLISNAEKGLKAILALKKAAVGD